MSVDTLSTTIRTALAEAGRLKADAREIPADADLYAAGLTSHATVNVVLELEDALDIEIPDELLVKSTFVSVGALHDALEPLVEQ
ncbi:acyl carrier protein [Arsenicicoccus sp. oral taxon 190]|uniref:acyl carrier protein n=1 Tax=Arsenicicoccus sp. oral taxon 190 TaxID=1658671 RepID=UPI00067A3402|nr:acyl carrier protein [Arsenicicoccus sp. oral taxon 190]AKT52477.1 acyl carrier protein [Arsenicicoccus sp. oral taxon 190]